LAELPPTLRIVFLWRDLEGLSTLETAEVLGISEAAVKVRLHRARLRLRESLTRYFSEHLPPPLEDRNGTSTLP
jgi:RNA polymerase sigma-70 factor (ECF subfamily)